MAAKEANYRQLLSQRHFLGEIDQGIRLANREIIHANIPELTKDDLLTLAIVVGRLRARYLDAALSLTRGEEDTPPDDSTIEDLRSRREAFEEARSGFDALLEAIDRGYLDIS